MLWVHPVIRILGTCLAFVCPLFAGQNPRLEYAFGVLAECRGDVVSASKHFENARLADPQAATLVERGVSRLGILEFSAKRDGEGEATLKALLAIHPKHALAHQALAKFYRLRGISEHSAVHSGEFLKIRGGAPTEFLKLADEHLAADRAREARLLLERAVFSHPDHLKLRMKLAIASHRDPQTRARSSRLFREAEALAPDGRIADPVFLSNSAEALIEAGQSLAGEERLRAAIRAYPPEAKRETAAVLRRLAALWETENLNIAAARALRQRAASLDPK